MTVKINLENAYEILDWGFINDTLGEVGIHDDLIFVIMYCISSMSIQVL